jgi:hypothetical protein
MKRPLILLILCFSFVGQVYALSVEDGSETSATWYYRPHRDISSNFLAQLNHFGLKVIETPDHSYEWAQDQLLFNPNGTILLPPVLPERWRIDLGLTTGIHDFDGHFNFLTEAEARYFSQQVKSMKGTLVEGGEVISGKNKEGKRYAIMSSQVLRRTKIIMNAFYRRELSDDEAKVVIASDLELEKENIHFVQSQKHLDLFIQALPMGRLIVFDPSLNPIFLEEVLKNPSIEGSERAYLETLLEVQKNGYQRYLLNGDPYGPPIKAWDDYDQRLFDEAAANLSRNFEVIRLPGRLMEPSGLLLTENINFFNGFVFKTTQNKLIVATNAAKNVSHLEKAWKEKLLSLGVHEVLFGGSYSDGAGLDCRGALYPGPN